MKWHAARIFILLFTDDDERNRTGGIKTAAVSQLWRKQAGQFLANTRRFIGERREQCH
jgi:hypothetical protein